MKAYVCLNTDGSVVSSSRAGVLRNIDRVLGVIYI